MVVRIRDVNSSGPIQGNAITNSESSGAARAIVCPILSGGAGEGGDSPRGGNLADREVLGVRNVNRARGIHCQSSRVEEAGVRPYPVR